MSRVTGHKEPGITVAAVVLTSSAGIDTVVKDLGFIEDAFGSGLADDHLGLPKNMSIIYSLFDTFFQCID